MEHQPNTSDQDQFQPFDDLVRVDAYGRGHRPDGKFLSGYEIEQIGAHQDQIRTVVPAATEYMGRHRAEDHSSVDMGNSPVPLPEFADSPAEGQSSLRAFIQDRFRAAKHNFGVAKASIGRLTENVKDWRAEREEIRALQPGLRTKDLELSKPEKLASAAYELVTLNGLRTIGAVALYGFIAPVFSEKGKLRHPFDVPQTHIRANSQYMDVDRAIPLQRTIARGRAGTNNPVLRKAMARSLDNPAVRKHLLNHGVFGAYQTMPAQKYQNGEWVTTYDKQEVPFYRDTVWTRHVSRKAQRAVRHEQSLK